MTKHMRRKEDKEEMEKAVTAIETMTDDIRVTIDDVLTVKDELVAKITGGDISKLPDVKELLIAIYIRGFFCGAHLQEVDQSSELMIEVVKAKLTKGADPH